MNNTIAKFLLILANSNLKQRELHQISRWLAKEERETLVRAVTKIRLLSERLAHEQEIPGFRSRINQKSERDTYVKTRGPDIATQVEKLLRWEAGLTVDKARDLLLKALAEHHKVDISILPGVQRKSFRDWIVRLSRYIPYSLLLQEASRIRKNVLNLPKNDWPLKDRD
jgi:hypothetical protein